MEEQQKLTVEEIIAAYEFCVSQRNSAQTENTIIAGRLAGAMSKVDALTKELEALKAEKEKSEAADSEKSDGNDSSEQE